MLHRLSLQVACAFFEGMMKFICGVHGVGKSSYCKVLQYKSGLNVFSASRLVDEKLSLKQKNTKRIDQIDIRQLLLVQAVSELQTEYEDFIMDGHLCLVNQYGLVERSPESVFEQFGISELYIVVDEAQIICERLQKRDNIIMDVGFVATFQNQELDYAYRLASKLNIELHIINRQLKHNIILPIKPEFAEKILNGEKRYEYRRRLCAKKIDKIYIYATAPEKRIIGEVDVTAKLCMKTEDLWKISKQHSGISKAYYTKYFNGMDVASAYQLGTVERYKKGVPLSAIGIDYAPQSFMYIGLL